MHKRVFDELFGDCVRIDDVSVEVFARMVKATAKKYGYSMEIDFSEGRKTIRFDENLDDPAVEKHIIGEVIEMMNKRNDSNNEGR